MKTLGFLGRQQVAWADKLFLTGGIRTDRNSAFGVNFARVYYPSISASWVVSEDGNFPKIPAVVVAPRSRRRRFRRTEPRIPRRRAVLQSGRRRD